MHSCRYAEPISRACIASHVADNQHYSRWQKSIIEARVAAKTEDLPGLVRKITLKPNLRDDLLHLRFSLDGKYLLAQDDSSIFVMTREPPAYVFRIDTLDAQMAQFSPDSQAVVFYDKELRVEKWDIASRQRTEIHPVTIPACFQSVLSPSGQYLACVGRNLSLSIVDVKTDKVLYKKEKIYELDWFEYQDLIDSVNAGGPFRLFDLKFSPDDRYFVLGHRESILAYDVREKAEFHIPGKMAYFLRTTFAFISPNEIAGIDAAATPPKLVRARFPSGDKIDDFPLNAAGWLSGTENGNYLLMRPAGTFPVGIFSLKAKKVEQAFKTPAFAIYGDTFAAEQNSGEIGFLDAVSQKLTARLLLPDSPLTERRVSAFSDNGKWVAISGKSRGAIWKLENGERIFFTHAFEGAVFDHDRMSGRLAAHDIVVPQVYQFDLGTRELKKLFDYADDAAHINHHSSQMGDLLIVTRPEKDTDKYKVFNFESRTILEARDLLSNKPLWERKLYEGQDYFSTAGRRLCCRFPAGREFGRRPKTIRH